MKKKCFFILLLLFSYIFSQAQENIPQPQSSGAENLLDYLEQENSRGITEQDEKNKNEKEFTYSDKSGNLRRFYYNGEGMSVNSYGGNVYITRTYEKKIVRKCFDENYRLYHEEEFSFDANPKNIRLLNLKTYNYAQNSILPLLLVEEKKDSGIEITTKFNEKGLASAVKTVHVEDKKNLTDRLESYLYDSQNRITEYELTTWSYKKNLLGRLVTESVKTKYEYSYHDEKSDEEANIPPDYKFYEDGVLRMERKYSAQDDFTEKLFFTDEIYVETVYQNGVKKLEIIYTNGKESRRREF